MQPEILYNTDQTSLFYQKLPNSMHMQNNKKDHCRGAKQMKDKTRVTTLVCTTADRYQCPLAIIKKLKRLDCFDLLCGSKILLLCKKQLNV